MIRSKFYIQHSTSQKKFKILAINWRRRWDSNPRAGVIRQLDFESSSLRPLRYVSKRNNFITYLSLMQAKFLLLKFYLYSRRIYTQVIYSIIGS